MNSPRTEAHLRPELHIVAQPMSNGTLVGTLLVFAVHSKTGLRTKIFESKISGPALPTSRTEPHTQHVLSVIIALAGWLADQPDDSPHS